MVLCRKDSPQKKNCQGTLVYECAFSTLSGIFGSSCSALDVQVAFFFLYQIRVQTQVNTNMKTKKKTEKKTYKCPIYAVIPPKKNKKNIIVTEKNFLFSFEGIQDLVNLIIKLVTII